MSNTVFYINQQPKADIARCFACDWIGPIIGLETEDEGDWENGYYEVHLCPKCGEPVDDYEMSDSRFAEWETWLLKNK